MDECTALVKHDERILFEIPVDKDEDEDIIRDKVIEYISDELPDYVTIEIDGEPITDVYIRDCVEEPDVIDSILDELEIEIVCDEEEDE